MDLGSGEHQLVWKAVLGVILDEAELSLLGFQKVLPCLLGRGSLRSVPGSWRGTEISPEELHIPKTPNQTSFSSQQLIPAPDTAQELRAPSGAFPALFSTAGIWGGVRSPGLGTHRRNFQLQFPPGMVEGGAALAWARPWDGRSEKTPGLG